MSVSLIHQLNAGLIHVDVSAILHLTKEKHPLLSLFRWDTERQIGDKERKFTWTEEHRIEDTATLDAAFTDGTPTATMQVSVATIGRLKVGDTIHLEGHLDTNNVKPKYRINAIASPNLTVQRVHGAQTNYTTGGALTGKIRFTRGILDGATATEDGVTEPTTKTNYYQTFEKPVKVGRKALNISRTQVAFGFLGDDLLTRGIAQQMDFMIHDIDNAVIEGVPRAEDGTYSALMGGIDYYVNDATNGIVKDNSGLNFSETFINGAAQELYFSGLMPGSPLVLLCHPEVSRTISAIRDAKVQFQTQEPEFGSRVQRYFTQIGDYWMQVVTHPKMSKNVSYILAYEEIFLAPSLTVPPEGATVIQMPTEQGVPSGIAWMENAKVGAEYSEHMVMRSDLSLKVFNANQYHVALVNYSANPGGGS